MDKEVINFDSSFEVNQIPERLNKLKIILEDCRKSHPNEFYIKQEPKDLESGENKVKKDPEGNFLFIPFNIPKLPKAIKREVIRKEIKAGHIVKFSKFQCEICLKYLKDSKSLNHHTEFHFQLLPFKCKKCERSFVRLNRHKCVKITDQNPCKFCNKIFSHSNSLIAHVKNVHGEELKLNLFYCDICNHKFTSKLRLESHVKKCNNPKLFLCDHCGKVFKAKIVLKMHMRCHQRCKIECKICHIKIASRCLLAHMRFVHQRDEVECEVCKKVFKNFRLLNQHKNIHIKDRLQCRFCDLKFSLQTHLNQHMKFHEKPEDFKCKICGVLLKTKLSLRNHSKTHEKIREKNFKCNLCDFRTVHKRSLTYHLNSHKKQELKLLNFPTARKCEKCNSVLKHDYSYYQHMQDKHENRISFCCDFCGINFLAKISIMKHFDKKLCKNFGK